MARWYDTNTRENQLKEMESYAREAAGYLHLGFTVLEIAPDPGYLFMGDVSMIEKQKLVGR